MIKFMSLRSGVKEELSFKATIVDDNDDLQHTLLHAQIS